MEQDETFYQNAVYTPKNTGISKMEYKSIILDSYITENSLNKSLKELAEKGWTLIPCAFSKNVLIFQRTVYENK